MAKSRKSKQTAQLQARKNRRKQIRRKQWQHSLGVLLASTTSTLVCSDVFAQTPSGANVVAGSAVVSNASQAVNVNASTNRTIVNWDSFSVGANHAANFNLPSANAAILNRVTSANLPSTINGALNSNGHVYLVNPSGIVVGSQGTVNTNGFTASTFDVSNSEFMAGGKLTFRDQGGSGSIINYGSIQTGEGGAHLIANQIANHGIIASNGGNVTLSGGGTVTLENGTTYVQASMETLSNGISPTAALIQNTGTIRATGAASIGGEVYLVNPNGNILHDGTIAAQNVTSDGRTTGGHVRLEAESIELKASSSIDASGTHGGGKVLVGGDWQGSGEMHQASSVVMDANATINASASQSGDGGTIVLWTDLLNSNSVTRAFGTLLARGGALLGNGGKIETSGGTIETSGVHVDAGALHGVGGLWLIDPFNYVIDAIAANNIVSALNTGTSVTVSTAANDASFGSSGNSSDNGDITVTADIVTGAMTGDATLTLQAARHIRIGGTAGIDATQNSNTARLNVKLWADTDNSGDGINMITAAGIKTNGGSLTFGNGDTAIIGGVNVQVGGDLYISGSVAQALETAGGDITVNGETIVANSAGGVTFDSDGGNIVFGGVLNSGNSYSAVNSSLDWNAALSAAKSGTGDQVGDTYLATITSRLENAIAGIAVSYQASWLGGRRVAGIGTDSAWRWVAGPEGLQDGGNGVIYAYQNASGGGTTAANGLFNNWNAGEPNNWNGTGSDPLSAETESAQQFTGNAGLWNDLPRTGASLDWYVRETNLAATAVTINAGTGTVTINGGVGGSKALASLDVTSAGVTGVNGSALVTTGAQNFSSALDVNSAIGLTVDGTTLTTVGAVDLTATGNVDVDASLVVPSAVSIEGAQVVIDGDISTSGATDASVLLKGLGDVIVSNGVGITTDGGDVTLWSDSDNSGHGGIHVQPNVSIDTRTAVDRIAGTHTTGGGSIVIAGGLDDAGVSSGIGMGTAGDGTPDGYAVNLTGTRAGIHFGNDNAVAHNTGINLFSGGGDILVNGKSTQIDGFFSFGVVAYQGYTFDGGQTGDITLHGYGSAAAAATGGFDMAAHRDDASGLSTIQTADGNIVFNGYSRNGTTDNLAIAIDGGPTAGVLIQATGSGNVTLRGDAVGTGATAVRFGGLDLLAASGDIQVLGDNGGILSTVVVPGATLNLGSAAGTGVTSSTSDILLQSDDVQINASTVIDTTGTLTVEPTGTSFTSSLTWPDANLSIASTLGGLTLGKEGNTADITISSAQTVGGPVNVYGGNVNINNAIDTSGVGADGDILLKGTGSISLSANGDLTTDGGNVILWSSSDGGNVDGYVNLANGSSISTNGGHVWLGGSTSKVTPGTLVGDGTTTWNGLTVGNGYAVSGTDVAMLNGGNWRVGIGLANANISTGGGDFYAAGIDLNAVGGSAGSGSGIVHGGTNGSVNAGSGSIEMNAYSGTNGAYALLIGVHPNGVDNSLTLSSSSNATTAVSLLAETASTDANFMGLLIEDDLKISATGTGDISLTGRSAADIGIRVGSPVDSGNLEALAASGTITINTGDDDLAFYNASSQSYFGAKAGSPVTSSSSDIVIIADQIPSNSAGINIDTTGTLAFEPLSTSGTSANLTGWSMGTDLTGLRVGKSTNAFATVTLGNALDINGPIDVYGSAIHLYNDITSNGNQSYTGDITLHGDIAFTATTGDLAFGQSIDGTYAVEITAGSVDFGSDVGAVTPLTSLLVNGTATLGGDAVTNGAQTWNDAVTVDANAILSGLSLDFGSTIDGQTNDLELRTDALQLGGNVSSTGALVIAPKTTSTTVGVGTGSGSLSLSQAEFGLLQDGFSSITIGGSDAGELKVGGLTSVQDNLVLQAGSSADLQVTDPISWGSDTALTLAAGQDIWVLNDIDVIGSGATLNLLYGGTNGTAAPAVGRNFYIDLANRRTIDFADTSANLKIGNETYTLIDSVADFTSMNSAGRYAFAAGLDLSGSTYSDAVYTTTFTGKLDGLGHAADGMIINNSTGGNLGLFAQLNGSTIRHLGITNFNIKTESTSTLTEYRIGGLTGNVGGAGTPVSSVTNIDGVWSSGVISTEQGGTQKFFFGGGLVGSQNGGFMNLSRSYSTANISTDGSYTSNLATGGLVGDIGINTNLPVPHTLTTDATVDFNINTSYATGSIVQGDHGAYFGSGGLIGVIFTSGGELTDSYSWGNVVGTGSFGGIAGYALSGTYERNYTTQASVGAGSVATASSYNGTTLPTATNSGTQLPSGWDSNIWAAGDRPTLNLIPEPARPLYVQVNSGTSSTYGDSFGILYTIVDELGAAVTFGTGDYANLTGTSGTGIYTLGEGAHAGSYSVSYLTGLSLTGPDATDFILNPFSSAGSHTVDPRTINVSTSGTLSKTYNGTTSLPAGAGSLLSFTNLATGDTGITVSIGSGGFNSADVLTANQATLGGLTISNVSGTIGSLASDYQLSSTSAVVDAQITPLAVVVSGLVAQDKTYDGTTVASVDTSGVAFAGMIAGDNLSVTSVDGTFDSAAAGTNIGVTPSNSNYGGVDASNYTFTDQTSATADITAATLEISGVAADNKFYDTTTNASLSGTAQITPVSGDDVILGGGPIANFADANANTNISVSVIGYILTGDDAGNYTLQQPTGLSADILPAPLTVAANDDAKFVTKSDVVGFASASFDGFVGGESIADLTGALSVHRTGTDELAGFYSDVLVPSGFTSTNYDITYVNGDFTIVPADQLLVRFGNTQSVYGTASNYAFISAEYMDGSNSVHTLAAPTVVGDSYTFDDGAGGTAEFTLSPVSEQLSSSGKLIVGNYVLDATNVNASSGNFSNQLVVIGNHTVVAAPINVAGSNVTKTYDGTTGMSGLTLALSGNVIGDDLSITGAGAYADRNVGTGVSYTVGNLMLDGTDKDNYYLANGGTISANDGVILAKNVTLVAPTASRTYDGTNAYVATAADLNWLTSQLGVAADVVQSVVLTFDNKNVGTGKTLSASNVVIDDANGGANYNISYANDTSSEIVRLGSVTWIGGPTGDWSDPSNWAGGAIPDLANVADVIIPDGVTPVFDSTVAGPVDIESLTGGNFQIDSGTLNVAHDATLGTYTQNGGIFNVGGNLTVADFAQNDGTLGVGGNLNVTNSFTQNPTGTIDVTGNVLITQATGDLDVWNLTGHDITLNSPTGGVGLGDILARGTLTVNAGLGDINQLPGTILTVYGPSTFDATGDVTLNNPGNDFRGPVNVTGQNVTLRDDHGGLILGNVTTPGTFTGTSTDGPITQSGTGALTIGGTSTFHARKNGNPADILLGNPENDFQGPVNADGKDIVIHDGHGGLILGTILASGNFTGKSTDGDITQTATGTITVHGTTTLEAFKNGVPVDIILPNPTNQFVGLVNIVARQLEIGDVDGSIEFGSFRTNEFDRMFAESSQSGVYDTNVRHEPAGSASNGGLAGYVLRTVNRLAEMAGLSNLFEDAREPVVAKDISQEQGEVYVRRETDFETVPVNSTSNDDDELDDVQ